MDAVEKDGFRLMIPIFIQNHSLLQDHMTLSHIDLIQIFLFQDGKTLSDIIRIIKKGERYAKAGGLSFMTNTEEKFGKYLAQVKGIGSKSGVDFKLREKEIKHIRRCLDYYDRSHNRDIKSYKADDLARRIYGKFSKFGKLDNHLNGDKKKSIIKQLIKEQGERRCSWELVSPGESCNETQNLTLAHIIPKSSGKNTNIKQNLMLLCPKHHLLYDLSDILAKKMIEIEKLKTRIADLMEKGTSDVFSLKTLADNKFDVLDDAQEIEEDIVERRSK